MNSARTFILYSTVAGVFSNACYFLYGEVMIQVFYLLMIFNLLLMLWLKRLWVPKGLLLFLGFLTFSGAVGIARGTDTFFRFFKDFSGISLSAFYSCCFFRTMDFDLHRCFKLYARMAYWVAALGLALLPVQWHLYGSDYRLSSVLTEASIFALVCLPALYYFADQWLRERTHGRELLVMLAAFIASDSSTGFLAMLLGVGLLASRSRRLRLVVPALVLVLGIAIYSLSDNLRLRFDDALVSFRDSSVRDVNLSTLFWYSNVYVTEQVFKQHPIMGNGLGSHGMSHAEYIGGVDGFENVLGRDFELLGAEDAQSLGLRVISDMGLVGCLLVAWFVWRFRPRGHGDVDVMCMAMCLYFFGKLLRGGHYFGTEQYFFVVFYAIHGEPVAGTFRLFGRRWKLHLANAASIAD